MGVGVRKLYKNKLPIFSLESCRNYKSNCGKIDVGLPQGSVLVPLLFLIHINDLHNNTSSTVLNFADDTLLYTTFQQSTYLQDSANISFEHLLRAIGIF